MKRFLIGLLVGLGLIAGVAYAAPSFNYSRTVIPEANTTYDLGSSSPAKLWNNIYTNNLLVNSQANTGGCAYFDASGNLLGGSACSGGGGGGGATTTINGLNPVTGAFTFKSGNPSLVVGTISPGTITLSVATTTVQGLITGTSPISVSAGVVSLQNSLGSNNYWTSGFLNSSTTLSTSASSTNLGVLSLTSASPVRSTALGTLFNGAIDLSSADASGILAAARFPALTGDITTSAGALGTTLATVNSNVGTFQGITVNGKGLVTGATNQNYITLGSLSGTAPITYNNSTGAFSLANSLGSSNYWTSGFLNASTTITTSATSSNLAVLTAASIPALSNLPTNGFIKTGSSNGTLSVDTNTYLTGNQTITLSGDISGSGATAITTAIGPGKVTNLMLQNAYTGITAGNGLTGGGNTALGATSTLSIGVKVWTTTLEATTSNFTNLNASSSVLTNATTTGQAYFPGSVWLTNLTGQSCLGSSAAGLLQAGTCGGASQSTSTIQSMFQGGSFNIWSSGFHNASTSQFTNSTTTGQQFLTGVTAGSILAVNSQGMVIATTTSAGGVTAVNAAAPITTTGGSSPTIGLQSNFGSMNIWTSGNINATTSLFTSATTTNLGISSITGKLLATDSNGVVVATSSPIFSLANGTNTTAVGNQINLNSNVLGVTLFSGTTVNATSSTILNSTTTQAFLTGQTAGFLLALNSAGMLVATTTSYQPVLTNPVTGTGVANQVSYWTGNTSQSGAANFAWINGSNVLALNGTFNASTSNITNLTVTNSTTTGQLILPNGSNPTVPNSASNIGIAYDTTVGQLLVGGINSTTDVFTATGTKGATVINPTASDNFGWGTPFDMDVTIYKVTCTITSTASNNPSYTFNLNHGASRAGGASNAQLFTSNQACTATTTPQALTGFASSTIYAGQVLFATSSAMTSASDTTISIYYKYNRQ